MLQLNSKELKELREVLGKWHVASFYIADKTLAAQKEIRKYTDLINSNNELIAKIDNGERKDTNNKRATLVAENISFEKKIRDEETALATLIAENADADIKKGEELISKEFAKSASNYTSDVNNSQYELDLLTHFVSFFRSHGAMDVTTSDVEKFIKPLGSKKSSNRQMCETSKHLSGQSKKACVTLILSILCDEPTMNKMLPIHKWETVIEKKIKKAQSK